MDNKTFRAVFSDLPTLETARLILKKITKDNVFDMNEYASLESVTEFLLWPPHLNLYETRGYIDYLQKQYKKGNYADWGLNIKDSGKFIGTCGFSGVDYENNSAELGYVLSPVYQGKGYMKEAVKAVLELAFYTIGIERIFLRIIEQNTKSLRFAESIGFLREGTGRNSLLHRGEYKNIVYYSMLREEFGQNA